jgi:hypothetical protein
VKLPAVLVLSLPCAIWAQSAATIYGTVVDAGASVLPGVVVTIQHLETGATRQVITDSAGNYFAVQLPVGTLAVRASAQGFKEWVQSDVVRGISHCNAKWCQVGWLPQ